MRLKDKDLAKLVVAAFEQKKLGTEQIAKDFWHLFHENKALGKMDIIFNIAEEIKAEKEGYLKAQIISASELDTDKKSSVVNELESRCGEKIRPVYLTDPSLGFGLKILIKDKLIDFSARNQIKRLHKCLNKGDL